MISPEFPILDHVADAIKHLSGKRWREAAAELQRALDMTHAQVHLEMIMQPDPLLMDLPFIEQVGPFVYHPNEFRISDWPLGDYLGLTGLYVPPAVYAPPEDDGD